MSNLRGRYRGLLSVLHWQPDTDQLKQWAVRHRWLIVLFLGVMIRVVGYFKARGFWFDELMLSENLTAKLPGNGIWNFWTELRSEQVVPPGYLFMTRFLYDTSGGDVLAVRMPAFLAGMLAFLVFARVAYYHLGPNTALLATALFACNSDLIYYCQEMKPYAFDYLATVLIMYLLTRRTSDMLHLVVLTDISQGDRAIDSKCNRFLNGRYMQSIRTVINAVIKYGWILFFVLIPWFSIASVFPIAAFWLIVLTHCIFNKKFHWSIIPALSGWLISFVTTYFMEKSQVSPDSGLWVFWSFAFINLSRPDYTVALLLDNLINPLHLMKSFELPNSLMLIWAFVIVVILGAGFLRQMRRHVIIIRFLSALVLLMSVASVLRLYPFHGRTILPVVPAVVVVFADGIISIAAASELHRKKKYIYSVLVLIAFVPMTSFLWTSPFSPVRPVFYDGDLEHDYFTHRFGLMSNKEIK